MDPSLKIVPKNAGMITFDPPYLQYWPNPSTAYGAASGFVILLIIVVVTSTVRTKGRYISIMSACIDAPVQFSDEILSEEFENVGNQSFAFSKDLHVEPIAFPQKTQHYDCAQNNTSSYTTSRSYRHKKKFMRDFLLGCNQRESEV
ncbi:hypothetical protein BB561_002733 [Smittium simulii]|uniref:Uncharacterized protein n=1 Tax=Smittium simulii TaxID=133385 RepID=A0A2T9YPD5_9FUNG|nr:hypothetical protein BB561_002733 [Smittium simulii]